MCFLVLVLESALERLLRIHSMEASVGEVLEAVEQVKDTPNFRAQILKVSNRQIIIAAVESSNAMTGNIA